MSKGIEIQADDSGVVLDDKILINGEDISRHITGYEISAHHGEIRKITLHVISSKHLMNLHSEGEVIPQMELGGVTYQLVNPEKAKEHCHDHLCRCPLHNILEDPNGTT